MLSRYEDARRPANNRSLAFSSVSDTTFRFFEALPGLAFLLRGFVARAGRSEKTRRAFIGRVATASI
jgi:hypothetical protein